MTPNATPCSWIAEALRRRGWRVAKDDSERAGADFLIMDDGDGERLIWLSVIARHELMARKAADDDVALCWRDFRSRDEVVAEHAAFIETLWNTPEGKRLKVALMWSHCDLASKAQSEWAIVWTERRKEQPKPPTPTLDAFGEILLTMVSKATEQNAAKHLAWLDQMIAPGGTVDSLLNAPNKDPAA
jgi:hypothetical protein